jgi:hypothetical protein
LTTCELVSRVISAERFDMNVDAHRRLL